MLQAYIDDSGNFAQGKTCLFAGCVASTQAWADFSERWDAVLKEPPAIEYFKMSEAFARAKQFKGWTEEERDAKVDRFVDVIIGTKLEYCVAVAMVNQDYRDVAYGATDEWMLNDPFFFLFVTTIEACLIHQQRSGLHEKVDFIFDSSSKPLPLVNAAFQQTMLSAFERIRRLNLVDTFPVFRDDKEFLPLQAADLIAGQTRGYLERGVQTSVVQRLSDSGLRIAYTMYDSRSFDWLIRGLDAARQFIQTGTPSRDERIVRFNTLRAMLESLTDK